MTDDRTARRGPKLLEQVRRCARSRHFSPRTEEAYVAWIRRYVRHHGMRHPAAMADGRSGGFPVPPRERKIRQRIHSRPLPRAPLSLRPPLPSSPRYLSSSRRAARFRTSLVALPSRSAGRRRGLPLTAAGSFISRSKGRPLGSSLRAATPSVRFVAALTTGWC